jgi:hypothetical protein
MDDLERILRVTAPAVSPTLPALLEAREALRLARITFDPQARLNHLERARRALATAVSTVPL